MKRLLLTLAKPISVLKMQKSTKSTQYLDTMNEQDYMALTSIPQYYDRQESVAELQPQGSVPSRHAWER